MSTKKSPVEDVFNAFDFGVEMGLQAALTMSRQQIEKALAKLKKVRDSRQ